MLIPWPELWGVFSFLFFAEYIWSNEVSQIILTDEKPCKKKKTLGQVFVRAHGRRVQFFMILLEETAWTLAGEYISVV